MFGDPPAEIEGGGHEPRCLAVNVPLAATKDLKLLQRGDLIEQILIKFDYIDNFNKDKRELPYVPAEDLENIQELLEDDVNMELGKSSLARKRTQSRYCIKEPGTPTKNPRCQANLEAMVSAKAGGYDRSVWSHAHYRQPRRRPCSRFLDRIKAFTYVGPAPHLLKTARLDVFRKEAREILV
ncbi:hypothetical protein JB92DRAFT_2829459 [Gautieria morchelliformis]|nr:hypothetical protein JB92DRAFT_2829459 [Gautieria morchelliformis]